jgi:hypothetical protein
MKMFRQGDLLFLEIDKIPNYAAEVPTKVILRGEATGHSHRLENGQLLRYGSQMYIKAQPQTKIVHEEHATINLEIGFWMVVRQREYSPWKITNVMD